MPLAELEVAIEFRVRQNIGAARAELLWMRVLRGGSSDGSITSIVHAQDATAGSVHDARGQLDAGASQRHPGAGAQSI